MNQNETEKRDSMVFYRSFYTALNCLSGRKKEAAMAAIIEYGLDGIEPKNLDASCEMAFFFAKPLIDKANERYLNCVKNGKKGGRPKLKNQEQNQVQNQEQNQERNQVQNQEQNQEIIQRTNQHRNLNDNDNYNVNDNDDVNENAKFNDNESVYVKYNTKKEPDSAGSEIHTYGEYNNVYLTHIEKARIISEFGYDGYERSVEYLSRYLKRKPEYKSACHFEDIRSWVQDAVRKEMRICDEIKKDTEKQQAFDSFADVSFEDIYEKP